MGKYKKINLVELAQAAYESYYNFVGGVSPITAQMLHSWHDIPRKEQLGWVEAVKGILKGVS